MLLALVARRGQLVGLEQTRLLLVRLVFKGQPALLVQLDRRSQAPLVKLVLRQPLLVQQDKRVPLGGLVHHLLVLPELPQQLLVQQVRKDQLAGLVHPSLVRQSPVQQAQTVRSLVPLEQQAILEPMVLPARRVQLDLP